MKTFVIVLVLCGLLVSAFAKTYEVEVEEKYVPYFEQAFTNENVTPSEWLGMQALNLVDQVVNRAFAAKEIEGKSRDEKISAIKEK